jgi:hypothetical protein
MAAPKYLMGEDHNMGEDQNMGHDHKRCRRCGTAMLLEVTFDRKEPQVLRCVKCDDVDPLKLPAMLGWIAGELRPPK